MTFAEIKELLNDGFTPEQITLLTTSAAAPTPAPDEAFGEKTAPVIPLPGDTPKADTDSPAAAPASDQAPAAAPASDQAPAAAPDPDRNKEIIDAIQDLKKTIQAGNILKNSMDTVDPEQALEKAMAEIIRPSFDKHE